MKLKYVLIGSDTDSLYLDFWPVVSKVWNKIFKLTPVLGLICDEESDIYSDEFGLVKKFKKIDKINVGLQSQIVRFYLANFLEGNCLVSDIDMLPLSKTYFETTSMELDSEKIIVHSSDNPECLENNMYPMCYFAAHSETLKKVFDLNLSWDEFCIFLNKRNESWYTDQKYLFQKIDEYNKKFGNVIFLKRGWDKLASRRIDRANWSYDSELVKQDYYIDSHLLRPYSENKNQINELINLLF